MGFLDRFKKKKEDQPETKEQKESEQPPAGKRIKKYTSDGKPVYE
jgi:hypothetical protein